MSTPDTTPTDATPTVVLVHDAFVDASSWNGVIAELKAAGLDVVAPPNLLRGVGVDAAYLTGFVKALGRRVVLVAHSYAGAVISQTGSDASNVAGLVYVAAYGARFTGKYAHRTLTGGIGHNLPQRRRWTSSTRSRRPTASPEARRDLCTCAGTE